MTKQQIIAKVQKLLALATSDNPNEAASAAAKAQRLMDEHKLSTMMLAIETEQPDEPLVNTAKSGGAPIDEAASVPHWRLWLATEIGEANGCAVYRMKYGGGLTRRRTVQLHATGRQSDIECAAYLYRYVWREIDRLAKRDCKGFGKGYANNYRLGAVAEIRRRLKAEKAATEARAREAAGANSRALMRIDGALTRLRDRYAEANRWQDENLGLRTLKSRCSYNARARHEGACAARSIGLGRARNALGTPAKQLQD